jgi:hypothetical protein
LRRAHGNRDGPIEKGSVYYGRCGSTQYAIATFSEALADQPEKFRKLAGRRWVDKGDGFETGCGDARRPIPRALVRLWRFCPSRSASTRCKPVGSGSVGAPGNLVAANTGCTTAQRVSRACLVDDTCTVVSTRRTLRVRGRSWRCSTSFLPNAGGSRTSCLSGPRVVRFDLLSFD